MIVTGKEEKSEKESCKNDDDDAFQLHFFLKKRFGFVTDVEG
jgi:hypothetical protein